MRRPSVRFDAERHEYFLDGGRVPGITDMLKRSGWIDERYFTQDGRDRGTAVHDLTADFDLGVLDVEHFDSPYRGYVLGYIEAVAILRPRWTEIEQMSIHRGYRFGGKPDRGGTIRSLKAVAELKSGARAKSHPVQTALQAILRSEAWYLPARSIARFAIYVDERGGYSVDEHRDQKDFDRAFDIIGTCAV